MAGGTQLVFLSKVFLSKILFVPIAYAEGLWFLIAHPTQFVRFIRVYKFHQSSLDEANQLRQSGYLELSRRQRREIDKMAKKKANEKA